MLRLEQYGSALKRLSGRETISLPDLVFAVRTLAPDQVEQDLRRHGIGYQPVKVEEALEAVERAMVAMERSGAHLDSAEPAEPLAATWLEQSLAEAVAGDSGRARTREAAWQLAAESPELFLFGHGRMLPDQAAFYHQVRTVKTVLEKHRGHAIVADEVGLGKTIIGCLLVFEILATDPEAQVLILAPANLVEQWCQELKDFFGLDLSELLRVRAGALKDERVVLMSIDRAKGSDVAPILLAREWDLLIVDEAHELRNALSLRARFAFTLPALNRVYLTATPVQNSGYDIYNLVTSLRPGFLNVQAWFTDHYMRDERSVVHGDALRTRLDAVITRTRRPKPAWQMAKKDTPTARDAGERAADDEKEDTLSEGFATRKLRTVWVKRWTPREEKVYDDLLEMLRGTYRRCLGQASPLQRPSGLEQHVSQFVLVSMVVLREMGSHTRTAIKTLETALQARLMTIGDNVGLDQLAAFLKKHSERLNLPEAHAKTKKLLDELEKLFQEDRSVLVYVCYRETLAVIAQLLENSERFPRLKVVRFHGDLTKSEKKLLIKAFRKAHEDGRPACLVSMDSGGQGLNLQTADTVVNYDYPWNPMKLEQRIGRIDRYGQKSQFVNVINLVTKGTIERYIHKTLQKKMDVFFDVIGDAMSPLEVEDLWEERVMLGIGELILSSRDAEDMRARFEGLDSDSLRRYMDRYERYVMRRKRWVGQ